MVRINLVLEGGAPMAHLADLGVLRNYESLRRSFNLFFSKLIPNDRVEITILPSGNNKAAAKTFLKQDVMSTFLYVDLDGMADSIDSWFDGIGLNTRNGEPIIFDDIHKQHTYFMIQAMEAWFLKQPECIDRWISAETTVRREHPNESIADHSLIKRKDIEAIAKPDEKLKILLRKYVSELRKDKWKSVTYAKQKHAANLLEQLDPHHLCTVDAQLRNFVEVLRSIS